MEPAFSFAFRAWREQPQWDSDEETAKALFQKFILEAKKRKFETGQLREIVTIHVDEFRTELNTEERRQLLQRLNQWIEEVYDEST